MERRLDTSIKGGRGSRIGEAHRQVQIIELMLKNPDWKYVNILGLDKRKQENCFLIQPMDSQSELVTDSMPIRGN